MKINQFIILFLLSLLFIRCAKLVQIPPPSGSITTSQVFSDSADAAAAINDIYTKMAYSGGSYGSFSNSLITTLLGESADELLPFALGDDDVAMSTNTMIASNGNIPPLWNQGYSYLYQANACIEGLQSSATISQAIKDRYIGEAKWFRAFIDFYLVNIFGNIPLINTTDYKMNSLASRTSLIQVYQSIINDLKEAQSLLPEDYSEGDGERIRVNKWCATAMLARVYLYTDSFSNAEIESNAIISNSGVFHLDSLNGVFLTSSSEAILQWQNNSSLNKRTYNATTEGYRFVPYDSTSPPNWYYLSNELVNAFENGDMRRAAWLDSSNYNGVEYYEPYKYKVGPAQAKPNAPVTEYYTILRLAEQYLIRAEARAKQNNLVGSISDLNIIRLRAGLTNLSASLNQSQVLSALAQERRIELFAEWGHRWLDLKRTNTVGIAFSNIAYKKAYLPFQQLYPLPLGELQTDPNLVQNLGY